MHGSVTAAGDISISSAGRIDMDDNAIVNAGTATIGMTANGDVVLGSLQTDNATVAAVQVTSFNGGVIDGGDAAVEIVANAPGAIVTLDAATGIGTVVGLGADSALEVEISVLDASLTSSLATLYTMLL